MAGSRSTGHAGSNNVENDAALVRAAKPDRSAFAVLYRRYVDQIYRYIYSRVGRKADAEDLTARVFTEALYTPEQLERARRWRQGVGGRWERLTEREREVLRLVVEGETNREIAQALGISEKTAGHQVSSVLEKLEVGSRTEAAVWAVREGFIEEQDEA